MNIKYCLDSDRLSFLSINRCNYRESFFNTPLTSKMLSTMYVYEIIATYNNIANPSVNKLFVGKAPSSHNKKEKV